MFVKSAVAVAMFASFVAAQTRANYTIDPNTVALTTRSEWCRGQENTCGTLCDGSFNDNRCDPVTLNYTCLCAANSSEPGLIYYQITLPTYLCEQTFANCDTANANNKAGKDKCAEARKRDCGTLNPNNYTATPATTSSAVASATSAVSSGAGVASTSSQAAAVPTMAASNFGTGVLAAGVASAFGLLL